MVVSPYCVTQLRGGRRIHGCHLVAFFSVVLLLWTAKPASLGVSVPEEPSEQPAQRTVAVGGRRLLQANTTSNASSRGELPLVLSEGGAQYLYPEMTMHAYEEAMSDGADFLICMIAITSDGQAICHPSIDLSIWTNVGNDPYLASRNFKFQQRVGIYSFNLTLAEIRMLKVRQTKPERRTRAFDNVFPVATLEEVIDGINWRAEVHPSAKRVGLAIDLGNATRGMEMQGIGPTPLSYAIDLLKRNNWTTPDAPAMVIATLQSDLAALVKEGVMVRRLLRVLPQGQAKVQLGEDLADKESQSLALRSIAANATGVLLHVHSVLSEREELFWGKPIPRVFWDNTTMILARAANLSVFVWGFVESDWTSAGAQFNTFLSDPLAMYRSLLYGDVSPLIAGLTTDWPATAAKAAACYRDPFPLFSGTRLAKDRPLIIASGGSVGLLPAHTNLSYLQAIAEGADYVDCTLQVSKDGVLFCLESMELSRYTDVDEQDNLRQRQEWHTSIADSRRIQGWWSFDLLWAEIQTLRVSPKTRNNAAIMDTPRLEIFYDMLPPLSFDDLISIAQNASREVGIFIKIDYPTFVQGLGKLDKPESPQDQIGLMLETLQRRGYLRSNFTYNPARAPPLIVASADSCGLARLHNASSGTLPLVQRIGLDTCELVIQDVANTTAWWLSEKGLNFVKTYASGISPRKKTFLDIHNFSGSPFDGLIDPGRVDHAKLPPGREQGLDVYPRVFRNDVVPGDSEGAFDFLSDPTIELQYYLDQLGARALDTQFVSTAIGYLESTCRPHGDTPATDPGFNITELHPGGIAREVQTYLVTTKKSRGPGAKTIGGIAAASVLMAAALAVGAMLTKRRYRRGRSEDNSFSDTLGSFTQFPTLRVFLHAELLAATNNFSDENRLGRGGFGTVYKGVLPDGRSVAVKKLHLEVKKRTPSRSDPMHQLLNEVKIIGTVHNRNVVPLEGVCIDKELLLVYEFMPNGSLQDAIFNPDYPLRLGWRQWYHIAVGTAKGLAYLHEECEHKIIHRDIKPANILLDAQLNARVADFGLARNVSLDESHITTKVMGSVGFMAPDYATTGQLTERSDTYSFGILLVTILTGRLPIYWHDENGEETSTLEWVKRKALEGTEELLTVIHPKFEGKYDEGEAIRWLYTALLCAQHLPARRPSMGDVVQMLLGKRDVPEIVIAPAVIAFPEYLQSNRWNPGPSHEASSRRSTGTGTPLDSSSFAEHMAAGITPPGHDRSRS